MTDNPTTTRPPTCSWEQEKLCRRPFHWDNGVPYCDECGLYRQTEHLRSKNYG